MTDTCHNPGRRLAFDSFEATLGELYGRRGVTEVTFRDAWLDRLRATEQLTSNGWYEPPPLGMAVLFGHDEDPRRVSFKSLRLPEYAPGATEMVWNQGMMYAYCSPLDRTTGLACDFGVTLYFGRRPDVREHFKRAFSATAAILQEVGPHTRSAALLHRSQDIFREAGLLNTIASVTDSVPLDLGHSMPLLSPEELVNTRVLTGSQQQRLRDARRFISTSADWALSEEHQVTIEPQLVSAHRADLPQVSFHYVVAATTVSPVVLRECDELLRRLDLAA